MSFGESQLFDAPETPGHVFAYRAFRNFFAGSPDSSPIRPLTSLVEDKENTYMTETRSPGKRSHNGTLTNTTPKRLRTSGASPSKSILHNPAEPTPRRAMLKDVNVTFQDSRKSVSPELSRKPISVRTKTVLVERAQELKVAQPDVEREYLPAKAKVFQNESLATESAQKSSAPLDNESSAPLIPFSDGSGSFDIKAYMQTTEREMRKLLKYGQKMRELAKKQEEENTRLRLLLKIAQTENTRLQEHLNDTQRTVERGGNGDNDYGEWAGAQKQHQRETNKATGTRGDVGSRQMKEVTGHSVHAHQISSIHTGTSTKVSKKTADFKKSQTMDFPDVPKNVESSHNSVTRSASRRLNTSKEEFDSRKSGNVHLKADNNDVSRLSHDKITPEIEVPTKSSNNKDLGGLVPTTTAISNIPPDRIAAAKERLRRRTEMRKASAGTNVKAMNEVAQTSSVAATSHDLESASKRLSKRKSSSLLEGNGSQLDWIGL